MLRPADTLTKFMYKVSDVIVTVDGATDAITLPGDRVSAITIFKDFDKKIIPVISITLEVPKQYYEMISTSLSKLNVTLSIDKYKTSDSTIQLGAHCLKGTFKAMNQDVVDPTVVGKLKTQPSTGDEDNNANSTQNTITIKLYLYDTVKLGKMRKMGSYFITGSLTDVLYYMFGRRGFNDVLMSVPLNVNDTYNIPYTTLMGGLSCLNNVYGIFYSPYLFFMDSYVTYLIDRTNIGKTLVPLEIGTVSMYLEEFGSAEANVSGCFIDDTKIILNMQNQPSIDYIEDDIEYYRWATLRGITSGTMYTSDYKTDGDSVLEKTVLVNSGNIVSQEAYKVSESRNIMSASFIDVDIDIFTPNKKYTLATHVDYQTKYRLNGDYRLSSVLISLLKHGESGLEAAVSTNFKKI